MVKPKPNVLTAVELGSPAAACAHFGICSLEVISPKQWDHFQSLHIRHVKAMLSKTKSGQLRIKLPLESMRLETQLQFFPESGFRVDSGFILPDSITEMLSLPSGMQTIAGLYPIKLGTGCLWLELALANHQNHSKITI